MRRRPLRLRVLRGFVATSCWLYVLVLVATWVTVRYWGDRHWAATLILFGPRWMAAAPLLALTPLAMLIRRRSLWTVLLAGFLVAFPVMGYRVPWRQWTLSQPVGQVFRLMSFNTHGTEVNVELLRQFISDNHPDIVLLSECEWQLESKLFSGADWYKARIGEYCVASHYPVRPALTLIKDQKAGRFSALACDIDTPGGVIPVAAVHLTSPHQPFSATLRSLRKELRLDPHGAEQIQHNSGMRQEEAQILAEVADTAGSTVLLGGDFNMPCDSPIYREHLGRFKNAFNEIGSGFGWTYEVERTNTRIDHILSGRDWRARRCWVGPKLGSPHHVLLADLECIGTLKPVPVAEAEEPAAPVVVITKPVVAPTSPTTHDTPPNWVMPPAVTPHPPPPATTPTQTTQAAIVRAILERRLVAGMTLEQATAALANWDGPTEVSAELADGMKLYRWKKGTERLGAAFDSTGRLKSFQKL